MSSSLHRQQDNLCGQCSKPQPVPFSERSLSSSVAGLVQEALPQHSPNPSNEPERVDWVAFDQPDLIDCQWRDFLRVRYGAEPPVVIVIGLARGFQIWALMQHGDCEELVSDRTGPVKSVTFLPYPQACFCPAALDVFGSSRPLVCVCDSTCLQTSSTLQHCTLTIFSLTDARTVHELKFDQPVCQVAASDKALVVSFCDHLRIFDTFNFASKLTITNCQRNADPQSGVPFSLKASWLAYADLKLSGGHKSCGGVIPLESGSNYTTQVLSVAKNLSSTLSAIGESVTTGLAGKTAAQKQNVHGVLSVVDVKYFKEQQLQGKVVYDRASLVSVVCKVYFQSVENTLLHVVSCPFSKNGIVSHFVAHMFEPIGHVHLAPRPSLLAVSGASSTLFHLFNMCPHPLSANLSAVQHLYTLVRGNTPARVLGMCFSLDCRWLSVTTNHGTTHVYPITPYGGPINFRSHGSSKIVNRESRYHKSSGLNNLESTQLHASPSSSAHSVAKGSASNREIHPAQDPSHLSLCRMVSNPRLPPYPLPTVIPYAAVKLHAAYLGALASWTPDLQGSMSPGGSGQSVSSQSTLKLAAQFASQRAYTALNQGIKNDSSPFPSLYIMNGCGELMEHSICVNWAGGKPSQETPVQFTTSPVASWTLHRTKSTVDVRCPLTDDHLLVSASQLANKYANMKLAATRTPSANESSGQWISQVEMITYSGPHRRLWMGPQFTFKTFAEPSQPTALVTPNQRPEHGHSEPMNISSVRQGILAGRTVPVLLEATSGSFDRTPSVTMEVCGSWSDNDYISCDEQEGRVRKCIAEAMNTKGPLSNVDDDSCQMEDARSSLSGSSESSRDLHVA